MKKSNKKLRKTIVEVENGPTFVEYVAVDDQVFVIGELSEEDIVKLMSSKSDDEKEEVDLDNGENSVLHVNKSDALKALETEIRYAETLESEDDSNKLLHVDQLERNVQSSKQMKIIDLFLNKN